MPKADSPESSKLTVPVRDSPDRQDFVSALIAQARRAETDRGQWEESLTRWFKKRQGIRPSSVSFPWPGASNVHIALVDEKIRKQSPNYLNLAFEGGPVVLIEPVGATPIEAAQHAEIYLDWLLRFGMNRVPGRNYVESLVLIVDWMLEQGFSLAKVIWAHHQRRFSKVIDTQRLPPPVLAFLQDPLTTDDELRLLIAQEGGLDLKDESDQTAIDNGIAQFRKGERYIRFNLHETVYSGPRVVAVRAKDLIVPDGTTHIEGAKFLIHRLFTTAREIKEQRAVGVFPDQEAVEAVLAAPSKSASSRFSTLETVKGVREGVMEFLSDSELIELWECYTWFDLNGDGLEEKVVLTVHPDTETILRFVAFPYDHGRWPFVRFDAEMTDDRWYSPRGLPQMLDHYQTILTKQENAKLDYMTLANSVNFKYRIGRINFSQGRFIPGQGIGVHRMEDLEQLHVDRIDVSFDAEMQKIRQLAETYIGQPDLALGNLLNPQERRTAAEVQESVALARSIFSLNARLFHNSLQQLYNQILDLVVQFGPEEQWVQVTGQPPLRLTRRELAQDLVIVPAGDFTMLSRTLEERRDLILLQQLMGDQSGAVNHYEALREYLLKHHPRRAQRILNSPEQFAQIQQMRMQSEQQALEEKKVIAGRQPAGGNGAGLIR